MEYKENYLEKGTAYINKENNPLDENDIRSIQKFCNDVEKEHILVGDAGENNNVWVGRFQTDVDEPKLVNTHLSKPLMNILKKPNVINYIKKIIDVSSELFIRRVQYNLIEENSFIGYHLDTDSNPDYLVACVLQLGEKFDGGFYRVHQRDSTFVDYKAEFGSLIISNCEYPHEVTKVKSGSRQSLVFFLSAHSGKNRRIA